MRNWLIGALVVIGTAGVLAWNAEPLREAVRRFNNPRRILERRLLAEGRVCVDTGRGLAADGVARSQRFTRDTLRDSQLYCRNRLHDNEFIYVDADGAIYQDGQAIGSLRQDGELLYTEDSVELFVDGRPLAGSLNSWDLFWVRSSPTAPPVESIDYRRFRVYDGFMRDQLADSDWHVSSGKWFLNQYGGGAPENTAEEESANFQRAVNPFTLRGRDHGVITLGDVPRPHCHAEARFYFGLPRERPVIDHNSLPLGTDMLLVIGALDGPRVAFGWLGERGRFGLETCDADGQWKVVNTWTGKRPPVTNWVKLGITLRRGYRVEAFLDGDRIFSQELANRIDGPVHLACGRDLMEVDDIRCWSLPEPEERGTPVYVKSRNFAGKELKREKDPLAYEQWTRSVDTFIDAQFNGSDQRPLQSITNRIPLFGDFSYESVPQDAEAGPLPTGEYEFRVAPYSLEGDDWDAAFVCRLRRVATGWRSISLDPAVWPADHEEFTLRFVRRAANDNRLAVQVNGSFVPVSPPLPGAVRFSIGRYEVDRQAVKPRPEHHMLYCKNLINEFFEESPTDWNWIEGTFRMDARWACQHNWNFLACGSTGVPAIVSKRRFRGDQEHEFFMSIRPVVPWDAGDATFRFEYPRDRNLFQAYGGWYNRHDLNFSFCCDGQNPLSGYSLVYAGFDNTRTFLLRKGRVIGATTDFLMPTNQSFSAVHWKWWHFLVRRYGSRLTVYCNDQKMFEYEDQDPLPGGYTMFWSVRNGFILSRVTSTAETVERDNHHAYVAEDAPSDWRPLVRDNLELSHQDGPLNTKVRFTTGMGFHGLRYRCPRPVDLTTSPVLELPVRLGKDCRVNLHLYISRGSYLVRFNAPLEETKSLLTPAYERGEQFQLNIIPESTMTQAHLLADVEADGQVRINLRKLLEARGRWRPDSQLTCLTIGNTSNDNYLLAGNGANTAGTTYEVGTPRFLAAADDE